MPLESVEVEVGLPWGLGRVAGTWLPDEAERGAAWEMYVELVTRASVARIPEGEGLLREVLSSLYTLFESTREILRRYGPAVARPREGSAVSFGHLAVAILNGALRPLLTEWHPRLLAHEDARPGDASPVDWERSWVDREDLTRQIEEVRSVLEVYAGILGEVCDAKSLLAVVDFRAGDQSGA